MCVCLSLSQWVRRVGDSSNWSACVLLHSRHASHCTILLISSALCTCTHTHKLSHFFTVSLTAFRHGVTPHFAHRFAHTIALLVCLCVCRRAAGVMDCRSKWRHMDICSVHPIKVSRIRSAVLFILISIKFIKTDDCVSAWDMPGIQKTNVIFL